MTCIVDDTLAKDLQSIWRQSFPNATILPVIGFPSTGNGVATLTYSMGDKMSINGLVSNSPLANNALYSAECINNTYLNLHEIMIPDVPGRNGSPSTAEMYVNALRDYGLDVAGVHFHWWGSTVVPTDRGVVAVHHQKAGMHPVEFSEKTMKAIAVAMNSLNKTM